MNFNIDLTALIEAIIQIALTALIGFLTTKLIPFLKEKGLDKYVKTLVNAAYTLYKEGEGDKKLNYVLEKLQASKYAKYFDYDRLYATVQSAYVELCEELGKVPSQAHTDNDENSEAEGK